MIAWLNARQKAIGAFLSAEAATWITALQGDLTLRSALIATLTPIAVGATVHQATNTP